ncbi:MAG: aldo/keto reductase [Deltaproteobacteria bacterium]|nr:aldo/keto reductase [Deltaproteobacteria bacterium]MBW2136819.1 aldo/keto reductase [Deltaproteobacteria bacterium]
MEKRPLGISGIYVTPIIMGTWQAGKAMWSGVKDSESREAIRRAYEAGITTFDTAEAYGNGHSERLLGKTLADVRESTVYATKVSPNHLNYPQVLAACDRSLKNLRTDYIDLYQIHWPAGSWGGKRVPIEETMEALNDLKEKGKIRAIGVSNFSLSQLQDACRHGRIDSLQPPYSLFWRHAERDLIPFCLENRITLLAYSPLAQGLLTGKFGPQHTFPPGDNRSRNKLFKGKNMDRAQAALRRLRPIAERHGATLAQLALCWVIAHPRTCAVVGASKANQVLENVRAAGLRITEADLREMDSISRIVTDHLDDDPVLWDT